MKIVLAPYGTRGDVQPMVVLGLGLQERGHAVTIAAPRNFADWVRGFGLDFAVGGDDIAAELRRAGDRAQSVRYQMNFLRRTLIPAQFAQLARVCEGADAVVGAGVQIAGPSVAERHGIPYGFVAYVPSVIRAAVHAPPFVRGQRWPPIVNRLWWTLFGAASDVLLRGPIDRARQTLDLRPITSVETYLQGQRILVAADPVLAPTPVGMRGNVRVAGGLALQEQGAVPAEVEDFLSAGDPPVLLGFGSMVTDRAPSIARVFARAAERAGLRLLIQAGWSDVGEGPSSDACLATGPVPHHALLPRVRAVVHHGGAGTTTAVARAGRPQWILPHLLDQFYWAHRVHALQLGPRPIPIGRVRRVPAVERGLRTLARSATYAGRARDVASSMRGTDGLTEAVKFVEALATDTPPPPTVRPGS